MSPTLARAAVALAVVVVALSHGAALSGAEHYPVQHLEIVPENHQPGADNTTYSVFAWRFRTPEGPVDVEAWGNVTLVGPAGGSNNCIIARDARAAGIDRDNDDPGTETDESLIGRFKYISQFENEAGQPGITVQMYDEDDFGGRPIHLNHSDEAVAKVANCINNPDTPGWYRWFGYTNGTGYDGEYKEGGTYSHWYYHCDCESYDDAVDTIGPPPSTGQEDERTDYFPHDGEPGRPTGPFNLTVTRENYDGSSGANTSGGSATATPTGTNDTTATDGANPTATTDAATATTAPPTDQGDDTSARTDASNDGTTTTATDADVGPTDGNGPGFGVAATVVALAAAALLARRY